MTKAAVVFVLLLIAFGFGPHFALAAGALYFLMDPDLWT